MQIKRILLTTIIILLITTPVLSQQYELNVGDRISISVWGHQDLTRESTIDPDGRISYPLVGTIEAEGKSINELKEELKVSLAEYIINPEVNVSILSHRKLEIIVMGAVRNEGSFEVRADNKLLDVISLAGGIRENAAAEETNLQRNDQKIPINLKELLRGNNQEDNYQLEDGDQIFVPEREILNASIQGEVRNPGQYELKHEQEIRLNEFLAQAGSVTENSGDIIRLISDGEPIEFELEDTLAAKSDSNPVVKAGDAVYIPSAVEQVTILGEISSPGSYEWNEDMRLANLIAQAGNTSDRANLEKIRLIHKEGEMREINIEDFFENNNLAANPVLEPGDLVLIGEEDSINWSRVFFMFSGFNNIKDFFDISW
ncbi:polysaccharide biosynthesis/export family protein [Halanaerobium hydrogeniformans]|uniref:Polysaccharide export protein n=1 Tax=Halanaerobium hydrogeniformans TaxID=656519 RepID=E4RPJ7_HALHG|nr:polysaccharide biosynthesis/export family protein [Halanaerobium hydrogeniformans]ADQ14020.1 polysaccharide export protein [Halanaerobium hydrogeniformans]